MSACVFMCVSCTMSVCSDPSGSLSVSISLLFSPWICPSGLPPAFSSLLPRTSRCSRVRFPVVGPAVSALPYLLKMLPLFVPRADGGPQRWDVLDGSRDGALVRLFRSCVLPCPNLLANLVNCAEVGVVHQLHEVPVPKLLIGHGGRASTARV